MQQIKALAQAATEANRAKSRFLANMSHEIRTPMNAIIGFGDVLAGEELTDEQERYVRIIQDSGENLLSLIDDILDLSKIEADRIDLEIVDCSLGRLLTSVESMVRLKAEEKGLDFQIAKSGALPPQIRTDPTRLRQCLVNIAGNAVKFTEHGHVHINVSVEQDNDDSFIRFDVEDTGIGIPPDRQKDVFESFTQADETTTRKYGGTGLGLTITKKLTGLIGGSLTLASQEKKGSVFTLRIPVGVDMAAKPSLEAGS